MVGTKYLSIIYEVSHVYKIGVDTAKVENLAVYIPCETQMINSPGCIVHLTPKPSERIRWR